MLSAWLMAAALAAEPEALYSDCRAADRAVEGARALEACSACLRADPWGQRATFCGQRVAHYRARQDPSGLFEGLSTLEEARRGRAGMPEVQAVLPGTSAEVAAEGALWLADQHQGSGDLESALRVLETVESRVPAASAQVGQRWTARRAELLARLGRDDEARLATAGRGREGAQARVDEVLRARRLDRVRRLAAVLASAWALVVAPLAVTGWRESPRLVPVGLLPLAVSAVLGGIITWAWEATALGAALGLGVALLLSHLLAAGALRARPVVWVRVLNVVGTLALAWWTLDVTGGLRWLLP